MRDVTFKLGVIGARGRLGRRIVEAARAVGWRVTLTATRSDWNELEAPDVLVDASSRSSVERAAEYCARSGAALLETVSGIGAEDREVLAAASASVPVLIAENLSWGHYVQTLALAAVLERGVDEWAVLVSDRHPITKRDQPSATCLALAQRCEELGVLGVKVASRREGQGVSDHSLRLDGVGETLTITHSVTDLAAAARGAMAAVKWLKDARSGLWTMRDVWQQASSTGSSGLAVAWAALTTDEEESR